MLWHIQLAVDWSVAQHRFLRGQSTWDEILLILTETTSHAIVGTATACSWLVLDVHVELVEMLLLTFGWATFVEVGTAEKWINNKLRPRETRRILICKWLMQSGTVRTLRSIIQKMDWLPQVRVPVREHVLIGIHQRIGLVSKWTPYSTTPLLKEVVLIHVDLERAGNLWQVRLVLLLHKFRSCDHARWIRMRIQIVNT